MHAPIFGGTSTGVCMLEHVPAPGSSFDWNGIKNLWPELLALSACPQDPFHHAEGDVDRHTRMVLEALTSSEEWQKMKPDRRAILFWAAVFHDIGKPATTISTGDGRFSAPKHSRVGEHMVRQMLWVAQVPMGVREQICSLILAHQTPFWLFERPDHVRTAIKLSLCLDPHELCVHAWADALGRICSDQQDMLDRVSLSRLAFEELGLASGPFAFANAESRMEFFENEDRDPNYAAYPDTSCTVTLVCGLPGTGKDTWIGNNTTCPVISLDTIRQEMKVGPTDNQGQVIQEANERAREFLRKKQDFCWNTTNVTRQNRQRIIGLCRSYNARVRIVYLETSPEKVRAQNAQRPDAVPETVIDKLARKMEPPMPWEGHEVQWLEDGRPVQLSAHVTDHGAPDSSPRT